MSDPRLTPANGRVAAKHLAGEVEAEHFVEGEIFQCTAAAADLLGKPEGRRVAQLLFGDLFTVFDRRGGYVFGQNEYDGYCGYLREDLLGKPAVPTHWVSAPATHLYPGPHMKLMTQGALYMGSEIRVERIEGDGWARLPEGQCVPAAHLMELESRLEDPVAVADLFLGTPYLWGGATRYGLDCSGLVQICWRACGADCPRDSDLQQDMPGEDVPLAEVRRGDLVFWKGHVALVSDEDQIIHANSHHMAVAYEGLSDAIARISEAGQGEVTAIKRSLPAG